MATRWQCRLMRSRNNPALMKLPYDPLKDSVPVAQVAISGIGSWSSIPAYGSIPCRSSSTMQNRRNPGKTSLRFAGNGSTHHMMMVVLPNPRGLTTPRRRAVRQDADRPARGARCGICGQRGGAVRDVRTVTRARGRRRQSDELLARRSYLRRTGLCGIRSRALVRHPRAWRAL